MSDSSAFWSGFQIHSSAPQPRNNWWTDITKLWTNCTQQVLGQMSQGWTQTSPLFIYFPLLNPLKTITCTEGIQWNSAGDPQVLCVACHPCPPWPVCIHSVFPTPSSPHWPPVQPRGHQFTIPGCCCLRPHSGLSFSAAAATSECWVHRVGRGHGKVESNLQPWNMESFLARKFHEVSVSNWNNFPYPAIFPFPDILFSLLFVHLSRHEILKM
jgi:hypothetical protein